ncbi:uncharacterized protein B0P05DRAFT_468140 [Gilbertella persicaria]|uniref:uncharacterized protein n=1 Tax=Gilbertella persicaria TaxID=101096 RepID=UPI0022204CA2|nr:uncharacterized protein B0P05DRAFT_468140 [Gilbertella persicaria]KAI8082641.1 hypothetical protein B0P05DRAFT_468140 [Gilbertella persicaria]
MIENWALCENCIGVWEDCIHSSQVHQRPYYLRRFEAGWIYTRLLDHGTELLAKLKEYELEALVLQKLLDQHMYRLGKRGKWYERLALVQANYLHKDQVRLQKKKALGTCIDAIHDPRVHQSKSDYSERISEEIIGKKSIWRGDDGSECSVEKVAIEYYQKQGYKGLHCENGIIRMIAVLLFWDVIFASIPGVFETPYQSEPLDLRTDAFYESINWNYELQDILEIAECIGPLSLASLCKLFFEEFGQRQGGMPDLCCWNYEKRHCLFSEETLTSVGIPVEVCHVQVWRGEDIFLK